MTKGRGSGKTPQRVTDLVKSAVAEKGQSAFAAESGVPRLVVQRYLKGIGEPTQATLEKLAVYFGTSVSSLRGEEPITLNLTDRMIEKMRKEDAVKEGYFESVIKFRNDNHDLMSRFMTLSAQDRVIALRAFTYFHNRSMLDYSDSDRDK